MAIYTGLTPARSLPKTRLIHLKASSAPTFAIPSPSNRSVSEKSDDHFGPATDRPPSPEMIRQVNKQMKDSHRRGPLDHNNPYSASTSSLSTISSETGGSERPASATDKPGSRGRDDHTSSFSRNLLDRRRLSKREQSISQSPANPPYSVDSAEQALQGGKESFVPNLFSRRKPSRDDGFHKRFQISNPFNFKHVLHTDREAGPSNQPPKPSNLLAMKATGPSLRRGQRHVAEGSVSHKHVVLPSSDQDNDAYDGQPASAPIVISPPGPAHSRTASAVPGLDHLMRRIRSSEELRTTPSLSCSPPHGPLRSHTTPAASTRVEDSADESADVFAVPPLRTSSRQAAHSDVDEQLAGISAVRPRTSGSFRQSRLYNPSNQHPPLPVASFSSPPASPKRHGIDFHGLVPALAQSTWPIDGLAAAYDTQLADVPEEEEQRDGFKRSRMSMASIASLRGSHSVPMLRRLSRSQRPMSGASETLGRFDFSVVHAPAGEDLDDGHGFHYGAMDESWEDDIDYCYEHEAEADCDYQWERRSMDIARTAQILEGLLVPERPPMPIGTAHSSPGMLSVPPFDGQPLQINTAPTGSMEAVDPAFYNPLPGNFSFPRVGGRIRVRGSHASSFKESQGFTLSPSLLIPDEFHHQLLMENGFRGSFGDEEEEYTAPEQTSVFDESPTTLSSKLAQWFHQRSSTSTTDSGSTSRTDFSKEGHNSASSSWSFLTRPTTSGTTGSRTTVEAEQGPSTYPPSHPSPSKASPADAQQEDLFADEQDTVPELMPCSRPRSNRIPHHKAHASESVIRNESKHSGLGYETPASRGHARTRTTSMSTQLPPVGQYSLFPRSHIRPMGDQI